eukprot:m.27930 g.27930  ORF g.27930 m.27930 type:complete len:183 (-) comp6490_c0_seq2:83-631(-)
MNTMNADTGGAPWVSSMPSMSIDGELLDAQVTGYEVVGGGGDGEERKVTMYVVAVVTDKGTYEVNRRYSEFRNLRDSLKRALPSETFHFPAKKRNPLKNNFGKLFLQKRQQSLNTFITRVARDARCAKLKLVRSFFLGDASGSRPSKVIDALPLGADSPDGVLLMDDQLDPLDRVPCKILLD